MQGHWIEPSQQVNELWRKEYYTNQNKTENKQNKLTKEKPNQTKELPQTKKPKKQKTRKIGVGDQRVECL